MPKEIISALLSSEKIELFSFLSLNECKITKKYLLDRAGITEGSVIIMAVPYASEDFGSGNVSEYAKPRDYHLFFSKLFSKLTANLQEIFPDKIFAGFADHSPIDERHAAALSGLGVIGKNGLLLTKPFSSFVFIGEIITDMYLESNSARIEHCIGCGKCMTACPVSSDPSVSCLSSVTQKKGDLTGAEAEYIKHTGCIWGCDVCQTVCPYTERALKQGTLYTDIPFFTEERLPLLTYRSVSEMSDADFAERAYSWRGRHTVLRNLSITENGAKEDVACAEKKDQPQKNTKKP